MKFIVFGFIFVLLNYTVSSGSVVVSVIPSFIGYAFLLFAVNGMKGIVRNARKLKLSIYIMLLFSAIQYALGILGVYSEYSDISPILSLVSIPGYVYIGLMLFKDVAEYEKAENIDVGADKLASTLIAAAICDAAVYASHWITRLIVIAILISLLTKVLFLLRLYMAKRRFMRREAPRRTSS